VGRLQQPLSVRSAIAEESIPSRFRAGGVLPSYSLRIPFEKRKVMVQIPAMNPDSRELRSKAIETTMAQFDFAKVVAAAVAAGWNISTRPRQEGGVPTPDEMQRIARELLGRAWDDEEAQNCEYCHGGLRAARTDGCLSLQFVVEESYFVAAIDAVPPTGPGG